jgi:hypothetical protein
VRTALAQPPMTLSAVVAPYASPVLPSVGQPSWQPRALVAS